MGSLQDYRTKVGKQLMEVNAPNQRTDVVKQLIDELIVCQSELYLSRSKYAEIYDLAPVGYLTLNRFGRICNANLVTTRLLGFSKRVLLGQNFSRYVAPDFLAYYSAFYRAMLDGNDARYNCKLGILKKNSPIFYANVEGTINRGSCSLTDEVLIMIIDASFHQNRPRYIHLEKEECVTKEKNIFSGLKPPELMLDKACIQLVIINLLRNALEAMRDNKTENPRLTIEINHAAKDTATISIHDNGPGYTQEIIDRLFDPYFTTKLYGVGLGLSISRAVVESHGGTLAADPSPPFGACFKITLPIKNETINT